MQSIPCFFLSKPRYFLLCLVLRLTLCYQDALVSSSFHVAVLQLGDFAHWDGKNIAVVLTGTGDDTSPQQFISLTVQTCSACHYHMKGRQASTGGRLRESAKSAKDLKKAFQERKILETL